MENDSIGLGGGSYSTYAFSSDSPLMDSDAAGQGFVDFSKALLEVQLATVEVERRLLEIATHGVSKY